MKSPLDDHDLWFLEAAVYQGTLTLTLAEGFESEEPEEVFMGDSFVETFPLEVTGASRWFELRFEEVAAWQLYDAEIGREREPEGSEAGGVVQVLGASPYLEFIRSTCEWFSETEGETQHYRIWTVEEVIDVISPSPPVLTRSGAPSGN
jgi:hypothetical protein